MVDDCLALEQLDLLRGERWHVQLSPDGSPGFNPAFDVTPARLVTALITERGVVATSAEGLHTFYAR